MIWECLTESHRDHKETTFCLLYLGSNTDIISTKTYYYPREVTNKHTTCQHEETHNSFSFLKVINNQLTSIPPISPNSSTEHQRLDHQSPFRHQDTEYLSSPLPHLVTLPLTPGKVTPHPGGPRVCRPL